MSPQQFRLIDDIFQQAVELPPGERTAYLDRACDGEPDLREQVEDLLRYDAGSSALIGTVVSDAAEDLRNAAQVSLIGQQVGPYKITREIGQGGMASVYEAVRVDDLYTRSVAIKLIARGMNSPEALARFRVERQVLASLQHPNIATLLDGGTAPDGRPYIVMEYIAGEPLLDYCRQHNLSIADRLELFCAICGAVHHAHQMLVIHRDIKPSNILVTADGVPKLLDFGIAKLLAPELVPGIVPRTMTILRRLTPQYASPEQVRGATLTTASDVYSLGVLLYELLTGKLPYETAGISISEIERVVCGQEPARMPRQFAGDLENIVDMALRKEPERRYGSAQQLADDIRRYLKGMPVAACEDTLFYLAGKLVRRNMLASAVFALLVISVAAGWISTIHEARRTEARFRQVRQLANTLLMDIPQDISNLPGSVPVRAKLVHTALDYLHSLSSDATGDLSLQLELAQAYLLVGDAQGDPDGPNLGHYREAIASYQQGLSLVQQVAARRHEWTVLNMLALLHLKSGDLQWRMGNSKAAFDQYHEALRVAGQVRTELKDPRAENLEREGYQRITRALTAVRRLKEALDSGHAAVQAAERFESLQPGAVASSSVASARMLYGDALGVAGRLQESRKCYEDAVTRMEAVVRSQPEDTKALGDLADAYRRLGDLLGAPIYFHFGEPEQAELYLKKALAADQRLADLHPESVQGRSRLALALRRLGSVERETKPEEAIGYYQRAITIAQALLETNPSDLNYQRDLANHRQAYAQALHRLGRYQAALQELDGVLTVQRRLLAQLPNRTVVHEDLFHSLVAEGDLHLSLHQPAVALARYEEALGVARRLRERDPESLYAERCLAVVLRSIGDAQAATPSQRGLAAQSYEKALQIWSRWRVQEIALPYSLQREREVARTLETLRR